MKSCPFEKKVIDYIEGEMSLGEVSDFENHLTGCDRCQKEVAELKRFHQILANDEVPIPNSAFFDKLKVRIRQKEIVHRRYPVWQLVRIFVPAAVVILMIFVLFNRPKHTVEILVPISGLLEDKDFNNLLLDKIIDERMFAHFSALEEYFIPDIEGSVSEFDAEQKSEFIKILSEKFRCLPRLSAPKYGG